MSKTMNPFQILKFKLIYLLLVVTFAVHWVAASLAGNHPIGDEDFYTVASNDLLHGVAYNFEHPPLVKAIVAGFIVLLGNNWVAWRLPIVLFSVLATYLTYKVALEFMSERAAMFAAVMLSLSTIFLFMGSMFMLDVPCIAFGLAGLFFALRKHYGWSGLMFGLSFLSKELGALMFAVTFIYLLSRKVKGWAIVFFTSITATISLVGLWIYDAIYRPLWGSIVLSNPFQQFYYMIQYQLTLNHTRAPISSRWYPPISWVTPFGHNGLTPMGLIEWKTTAGNILALWVMQPNIAVEYFMLPLLIILPLLYWKRKDGLAALTWLWLALTYLPWFFAGFFVKTEADFYIIYAIPFLAIGSTYLWTTIKNRKLKYTCAITQLTIGLISFTYYFIIFPFWIK